MNLPYCSQRPQLCVRQGIWKTSSLELQPIKDTEAENIFCCSSNVRSAGYLADGSTADEDLFVAPC
jgi:hypothetical protein